MLLAIYQATWDRWVSIHRSQVVISGRPLSTQDLGIIPTFFILDGMRQDPDRRFWIERLEALEDNCDIEEDNGQESTGVKIVLQMPHNTLTIAQEYIE